MSCPALTDKSHHSLTDCASVEYHGKISGQVIYTTSTQTNKRNLRCSKDYTPEIQNVVFNFHQKLVKYQNHCEGKVVNFYISLRA